MKKILKHNLFYLIINLLNASISFVLIPLYISTFTVSDYGIFSLMTVFYALITVVITINIHSAFQTYYFDYQYNKQKLKEYFENIYSFALFFAIISTTCFIVLGPLIFDTIFTSDDIAFYPNGLIIIISGALAALNQIYFVLLRNQEDLKKYGNLILISIISNISFQVLFIVFLDWGVTGALFGYFLANFIIFVIVILKSKFALTFKITRIKNAINYSLWFLPFLLIQWFLAKGDRIIIENLIGLNEVGIYALLVNVSMIISIVATSILTSFRPTIFKEFKVLSGKLSKQLLQLFIYYASVILITSIGIYIIVQNIEKLNISSNYYQIKEYISLALILFLVRVLIRFFNEYLSYLKKSRDLAIFSIFNLLIFLFLIAINIDQLTLSLLLKIIIANNLILLIITVARCYYLLKLNVANGSK